MQGSYIHGQVASMYVGMYEDGGLIHGVCKRRPFTIYHLLPMIPTIKKDQLD